MAGAYWGGAEGKVSRGSVERSSWEGHRSSIESLGWHTVFSLPFATARSPRERTTK